MGALDGVGPSAVSIEIKTSPKLKVVSDQTKIGEALFGDKYDSNNSEQKSVIRKFTTEDQARKFKDSLGSLSSKTSYLVLMAGFTGGKPFIDSVGTASSKELKIFIFQEAFKGTPGASEMLGTIDTELAGLVGKISKLPPGLQAQVIDRSVGLLNNGAKYTELEKVLDQAVTSGQITKEQSMEVKTSATRGKSKMYETEDEKVKGEVKKLNQKVKDGAATEEDLRTLNQYLSRVQDSKKELDEFKAQVNSDDDMRNSKDGQEILKKLNDLSKSMDSTIQLVKTTIESAKTYFTGQSTKNNPPFGGLQINFKPANPAITDTSATIRSPELKESLKAAADEIKALEKLDSKGQEFKAQLEKTINAVKNFNATLSKLAATLKGDNQKLFNILLSLCQNIQAKLGQNNIDQQKPAAINDLKNGTQPKNEDINTLNNVAIVMDSMLAEPKEAAKTQITRDVKATVSSRTEAAVQSVVDLVRKSGDLIVAMNVVVKAVEKDKGIKAEDKKVIAKVYWLMASDIAERWSQLKQQKKLDVKTEGSIRDRIKNLFSEIKKFGGEVDPIIEADPNLLTLN